MLQESRRGALEEWTAKIAKNYKSMRNRSLAKAKQSACGRR
jgi:hypothetical protein